MDTYLCVYFIKHDDLRPFFPEDEPGCNEYDLMCLMDDWHMDTLSREERKRLPPFDYPFQSSTPGKGDSHFNIVMVTRVIDPPEVLTEEWMKETEQDKAYKANFIEIFDKHFQTKFDEKQIIWRVLRGYCHWM